MKNQSAFPHVGVSYFLAFVLILLNTALPAFSANSATLNLPDMGGDYEIYSTNTGSSRKNTARRLLPETPRQALNEDGLIGFFS